MEQRKFNGERLKNARIYKGITLTELAEQSDIKKQSISLYENGKNTPDYEKVRILSNILDFLMSIFFRKIRLKLIQKQHTLGRKQLQQRKNVRLKA